jgi:predicted AAA+ superfamily ATPase
VFDAIPGQLSKHEKKFALSAIDKNARNRSYEGAFFWLGDAHIANICLNATDPGVGLSMSQDNLTLKCYMADTGLLVASAFASRSSTPSEVYKDILLGRLEVNEGMLTENIVAQQLAAAGHRLFFYSRYSEVAEERMEIDFLIAGEYENAAMRLRVCPIEVKSRSRYGTSSLDKLKNRFAKRIGTQYVVHPKQLIVDGDRVFIPLYMSFCL